MDRRKAIEANFWIMGNGAKWKDLPKRFGSCSAIHACFQKWTRNGAFEGPCATRGLVEERDGYRLYECFIDSTFSKANGGGDGIGVTKAAQGVRITVLVDARGLPVAVTTGSATPHESKLVQGLFDFMLTSDLPERIIGDKAYGSDALDEDLDDAGIALIAPHPQEPQAGERDAGRPRIEKIQASLDGGTDDLVVPELPPRVHPVREVDDALPGLPAPWLFYQPAQTGLRKSARAFRSGSVSA